MQRIVEQYILFREANEVVKLWRPFSGATLSLFQYHQLRWIPEVKKNTVRLV
jgi:hypothetical protein